MKQFNEQHLKKNNHKTNVTFELKFILLSTSKG